MGWDCGLRAAADLPLLWFVAGEVGGASPMRGFFGGRPRLLMGPWSASITRLSLSRSATSSAMMRSAGMRGDRKHTLDKLEGRK